MSAKLGILIVHGMGSQKDPQFANPMIDELNRRLRNKTANPDDIVWQPVYWADILQPQENALWEALAKDHKLSFEVVRRFVLSNLGDAVAYQRQPDAPPDVYQRIHRVVHGCIAKLRERLGNQDAPLMVMAHSLGAYIMSNYIWDQQRQNKTAIASSTDFEKMRTLCTLVTFGTNIAIFSLALQNYVGIAFPASELKEPLRSAARWLNFFDGQDILGYPIKPLWEGFAHNPQIEDRQINVGGLVTSWNPLSHDRYWTDNDFTEPVAQQIVALLNVI